MFKFITQEPSQKKSFFCDVKEDQFFIDKLGYLSQKVSPDSYINIADQDGRPAAMMEDKISPQTVVRKIFPIVKKIEF